MSNSQHPSDLEKKDSTSTSKSERDLTLSRRPWRLHPEKWERILNYEYDGKGTEENPYLVDFIENDAENPMLTGECFASALRQINFLLLPPARRVLLEISNAKKSRFINAPFFLCLPKAKLYRWMIVLFVSVATLAVSLASSAYSGAISDISEHFGESNTVR